MIKVNLPPLSVVLTLLVLGASIPLHAQNPIPSAPRSLLPRDSSLQANAPAPVPPPPAAQAPLSTTAATPSANQNVLAAGADYILASSDTLEMSVFHEPDLTTQTRIAGDGTAQFPLIGEMRIAGMPLREARELIRRRYNADYLVEPQVYLNVIGYAQRKFTILGQVAKPGSYDFPPGEHLSLLEAVGLAGGFTRLADQGGVTIKRASGGSEQLLKINAKKLTSKNGKAFELVAGDVVTVGESWF